uniref:Uncharacterized protein n=1 Tax=Chlamydomonas leiostraca TaxID=1034604 RepID=A0A7S0S157_9CHLO|mmetsp:Transcript_4174/g.10430  ORF Transcript_4174/g.10430 Transcript_4174/m.10430 type:complete len:454 (+) Transcript_4174:135-1496(+)|eukprot:CAMPEP_0202878192 /NCGR_PEP_ID=MMETSP1391-20130828/31791_1 /ASSEMBLY_ACC=CAM_ASM_000867 /TAXON_ID=1034604 /ORGANISM="Chlamydomonas leiostraca, Strain SAG 11-49" /LENGTH=453 /DNA_ID=CAMNT_0049560347 /DNA_START=71 /DNA_END=1432 /DNA_ORIENTATION=+
MSLGWLSRMKGRLKLSLIERYSSDARFGIASNSGHVPHLPQPRVVEDLKQRSWSSYKLEDMRRPNIPHIYLMGTNHADVACARKVAQVFEELQPSVVAVEYCESRRRELLQETALLGPILDDLERGHLTERELMVRRLGKPSYYNQVADTLKELGHDSAADELRRTGWTLGLEFSMGMHKAVKTGTALSFIDFHDHSRVEWTFSALDYSARKGDDEKYYKAVHDALAALPEDDARALDQVMVAEQCDVHAAKTDTHLSALELMLASGKAPASLTAERLKAIRGVYHRVQPYYLWEYYLDHATRIRIRQETCRHQQDGLYFRDQHMAKKLIGEQERLWKAGKHPGPILAIVGAAHVPGIFERLAVLGPQLLPHVYGPPLKDTSKSTKTQHKEQHQQQGVKPKPAHYTRGGSRRTRCNHVLAFPPAYDDDDDDQGGEEGEDSGAVMRQQMGGRSS